MTYFNPKIFCKQNLHEEDRNELDYWYKVFSNVIDSAEDNFCERLVDAPIMKDLSKSVCKMVCDEVRESLGYAMQDHIIGFIAHYEDVKEVENPDTYFYKEKDE